MDIVFQKPKFLRALGAENIRFALNSIMIQKLRSFLTLLGIVVGVATVITMVSLVAGFNRSISELWGAYGATRVTIQKFDMAFSGAIPPEQFKRPNFVLDDVDALKRNLTLAKAISPTRSYNEVSIKNSQGDEANSPSITGVVPEYEVVNHSELDDGRFFIETDITHSTRTCIVGADVASALFPGKDPIGREIFFNGASMRIVGLLKKKGAAMGISMDNLVLIPISTFDEMYPHVRNGQWNPLNISLVPHSAGQVPDLIDEVTVVMRARRGLKPSEPNNFVVTTMESMLEQMRTMTNRIASVMILIASIALVVGGVGVMNIMLVSVTERTREIGVRKALGATRKDIAGQFLVEAMTLTCTGGAAGIALGIGCGYLVKVFSAGKFNADAPLWAIILGFGVSTGVGLVSGMWPALKAARQDPIVALRYE